MKCRLHLILSTVQTHSIKIPVLEISAGNIKVTELKIKSTKAPKCPTCGAQVTGDTRPFCSKRCADIDLGNWFKGKYAVPAVEAADDTLAAGDRLTRSDDDNH